MKIIPDTVCIGYVHPGFVTEGFTRSLANTCLDPSNRIIGISTASSARHEHARNMVIGDFLRGSVYGDGHAGAEWLMWIDTDMTFDRDSIARLRATAKKTKADMVSGLGFVYKRGEGAVIPNAWDFSEETQEYEEVTGYEPGRIYEINGTGTGFLLVNRRVFESNERTDWHKSGLHPTSGKYMGHDLAFCYDTVVAGDFKLVWDTNVKTGHIKYFEITEENYRASKGLT